MALRIATFGTIQEGPKRKAPLDCKLESFAPNAISVKKLPIIGVGEWRSAMRPLITENSNGVAALYTNPLSGI